MTLKISKAMVLIIAILLIALFTISCGNNLTGNAIKETSGNSSVSEHNAEVNNGVTPVDIESKEGYHLVGRVVWQ